MLVCTRRLYSPYFTECFPDTINWCVDCSGGESRGKNVYHFNISNFLFEYKQCKKKTTKKQKTNVTRRDVTRRDVSKRKKPVKTYASVDDDFHSIMPVCYPWLRIDKKSYIHWKKIGVIWHLYEYRIWVFRARKGVFLTPVKVSLTPETCQIDPFTCSSEDPNATLVQVSNDTYIFTVYAF